MIRKNDLNILNSLSFHAFFGFSKAVKEMQMQYRPDYCIMNNIVIMQSETALFNSLACINK